MRTGTCDLHLRTDRVGRCSGDEILTVLCVPRIRCKWSLSVMGAVLRACSLTGRSRGFEKACNGRSPLRRGSLATATLAEDPPFGKTGE